MLARVPADFVVAAGQTFEASFNAAKLHIFDRESGASLRSS